MNRLMYRILICLHPANFREQHGDEMLCIFDESAPGEARNLIADGFLSVVRQWAFHSGWWKLLVGAAISSVFLLGWAYSMNRDFDWSMRWGAERSLLVMGREKPISPLNRLEFERDAQQAAKMLEQYRRSDEKRRRGHIQPDASNPNAPAIQDAAD